MDQASVNERVVHGLARIHGNAKDPIGKFKDSENPDFSAFTFFMHKRKKMSKKVVCTMKATVDYLLCTNTTGTKRNTPFGPDHAETRACGGKVVKAPILTSITYIDDTDKHADCNGWFSWMDGMVRNTIGFTAAVHTARKTRDCWSYEGRQALAQGRILRGRSRRGIGSFLPFRSRHPAGNSEEVELGEAAGTGRRGGGFAASATFVMGGSNRAGNSEEMLG